MNGKIIAVWGSPNSGKTTFATKLATAIYESFETTVIVLYTDLETPVLPILFPFPASSYLHRNDSLHRKEFDLQKYEAVR